MKKIKSVPALVSLILSCAMAINFSGCAVSAQATDLMGGIVPKHVEISDDLSSANVRAADFALRLFNEANADGSNTLISPLSVICALAMTVNGAAGETKEQLEEVIGMSAEELNSYLFSYISSLPSSAKGKLSVANSIWLKNDVGFSVNDSFLQTNADYYGADIFKSSFDSKTLDEINNWVKKETDGTIPKILDRISNSAIMYLINALSFEAKWQEIYEKDDVKSGKFTNANGEERNVAMLHGTVGKYLEDEHAKGFIKYYEGGGYAFVALLPNEGVSVYEYLSTLDGEALLTLLSGAEDISVMTAMPKFEVEYEIELSKILGHLGITDAFDGSRADFSALGSMSDGSNIHIDRVIHKTYIRVGEQGTKAGAATAVEFKNCSMPDFRYDKRITLDKPFVYMLIDCENNVPFFIGTMTDVKG